MGVHTTNYFDTFISIADDSPAICGETPPIKGDKRTVANITFDMIGNNPYRYTSDEVLYELHACKNDLTKKEYPQAREQFFSKGQACLRASPLTKRYGWGVHFDHEGKAALYSCDSKEYKDLSLDKCIKQVKAMRSSKR